MNDEQTAVRLNELLYLEEAAVGGYDAAVERVSDQDTVAHLYRFRQDHAHHAEILRDTLEGMHTEAMPVAPEVRALADELTRVARAAASEDQAMESLLLAERVLGAEQRETMEAGPRPEYARTVHGILAEERAHARFVTSLAPGAAGVGEVRIAGGGVTREAVFGNDVSPDDLETSE